MARAPHDQTAFADAAETHDERWIAPRAALDGFAELRPGHTGSLRLNFPRKLRLALKQALRHRTIHAVLVTDGSAVAGIDTIHRVHVRLRMH